MLIWELILIQVINFVLIIVFLRFLFYRQYLVALKRLQEQELRRQNLDKEVSLNKELERVKQERQLEVEKGKEEAKKIKDAARQEAETVKEQLIFDARQKSDALCKDSLFECERLKQEAMSHIEESSIALATGLIREIFSEKSKQVLEKELVDELIEDLRNIEKEKIKTEVKKAEVTTSYPLLESQKNSIRDILQDAAGAGLELEEKIDASIISGLIINLGGLILDGSLQNKLRKMIPYLREEGARGIK